MSRPVATPRVSIRVIPLAAVTVLLGACVVEAPVAEPVYAPSAAVTQVDVAPPPLPVYEQPPCPVDGWIWTPGYWAWSSAGYYWVPGTWVAPPRVGVLWTPGYWAFAGGAYMWHPGYWGPHVGFYGGVHYGHGYTGAGYAGGRWVGNRFAYNRSVTNVNTTIIHNTYNETVINNVNVTRVSYNGGAGIRAQPTAQDRFAEREQHVQPTAMQREHVQQAESNPALMARTNHGHPAVAATPRPGRFEAPGAVGARGPGGQSNGRPAAPPRYVNPGNAAHAAHDMRRPAAARPSQGKQQKGKRRPESKGRPD